MREGMSQHAHGRRQGKTDQKATATRAGGRLHNQLFDCRHLHHITLYISGPGSSYDPAFLVGGALERTFQPLRNERDHRIPSCTAVAWEEEASPKHKAAKAFLHRYQALRLVLKPGRIVAPSRLLTYLREGAHVRKFAEPSDDLHHIACLSSVRACYWLRLRPRYCGRLSLPC